MKVTGISAVVSNDDFKAISALWERFYQSDIAERISSKVNDHVVSVYTNYQGDHEAPYTLVIGYEVEAGESPSGQSDELISVEFDISNHTKYSVTGALPDVVIKQWAEIWASQKPRAYKADCDIYYPDGRVDIFVEYL